MAIIIANIDFTMLFQIGTVIIGIIALYKSIGNYRLIRSKDYLLLFLIIFGMTLYTFYGLLYRFEILMSYGRAAPDGNQLWWDQDWTQIILNTAFGIMIVAFVIHSIRLYIWKNSHIITKIILLVILFEGIAHAFYYFIYPIYYFEVQEFVLFFWSTPEWFLQLWFLHWIIQPPVVALNALALIIYPLLVIAYLYLKPVKVTRSINSVRYLWIFFGITQTVRTIIFLTLTWDMFKIGYDPLIHEFALDIVNVIQFIAFAGILIIVAFYPETLLITETQLIQAKILQIKDPEDKKRLELGCNHKFIFAKTVFHVSP
jgi:hypothetical protein